MQMPPEGVRTRSKSARFSEGKMVRQTGELAGGMGGRRARSGCYAAAGGSPSAWAAATAHPGSTSLPAQQPPNKRVCRCSLEPLKLPLPWCARAH